MCVTDGGHYDNLGLVEALQRAPALGVTHILVLDASGDKADTWFTLGGVHRAGQVRRGNRDRAQSHDDDQPAARRRCAACSGPGGAPVGQRYLHRPRAAGSGSRARSWCASSAGGRARRGTCAPMRQATVPTRQTPLWNSFTIARSSTPTGSWERSSVQLAVQQRLPSRGVVSPGTPRLRQVHPLRWPTWAWSASSVRLLSFRKARISTGWTSFSDRGIPSVTTRVTWVPPRPGSGCSAPSRRWSRRASLIVIGWWKVTFAGGSNSVTVPFRTPNGSDSRYRCRDQPGRRTGGWCHGRTRTSPASDPDRRNR